MGGNPISSIDPFGLASINLGSGWTGRVDPVPGTEIWEIHVFDPQGNEAGLYNQQGWFNKHGKKGAPAGIPEQCENRLRGEAIDQMRRRGHIPGKGLGDIKGGNWKKFARILGPLGLVITIGIGISEGDSSGTITGDVICGELWGCGDAL
ncbi:hypothetical protein S2091_3039 [Solimicrobium silvestre]|uniref:Uncharacterized protein n=1 Tax=Solimicrobium silvestre TaxID=2099400 RepID=A0A2S9GXE3_9BURK|nr:hypothetical protein S2091_3039 [Solimicrobium silvestre]